MRPNFTLVGLQQSVQNKDVVREVPDVPADCTDLILCIHSRMWEVRTLDLIASLVWSDSESPLRVGCALPLLN